MLHSCQALRGNWLVWQMLIMYIDGCIQKIYLSDRCRLNSLTTAPCFCQAKRVAFANESDES